MCSNLCLGLLRRGEFIGATTLLGFAARETVGLQSDGSTMT